LLLARIVSDCVLAPLGGALAEERATAGEAVYRYEFGYRADNWRTPIGATHCIDVPFVFDTVDWARIAGDRADRYELAREVSSAWLSFAETGVPTLPDGRPWPRFAEEAATTVLIDAPRWGLTTSRPTRELG
jgi:para-nitrobenzyl esterase